MKLTHAAALLSLLIGVIRCAPSSDKAASSPKSQIDAILRLQDEAYDLNNEDGRKQIQSTCVDSLLFIGGDTGGLSRTADYYVHDLADGYIVRPHDRVFAIYDNTAIVTSLQESFKVFNKDTIHFHSRATKVFVREGADWKMAFVTYAPLPVNYTKATSYNPAAFRDYVGIYQGGLSLADTISVEDDKLFLTSAGSPRSELIPLNDSTFIGSGYTGRTVFSRNSKGRVTHCYFEFPDGQRIHFRKLR